MARRKARSTVGVGGRWSAAEAERILEEQRESGLSVREFARDNEIDAQRLYAWRRRLSRSLQTGAFFEVVRPAPDVVAATSSSSEVVLRSGDVIRLHGEVDAVSLRRIVEVLRSC